MNQNPHSIHTIVLGTRPQTDTTVAIFILKHLGGSAFPGIKDASIEVWQKMPDGVTEADAFMKGCLLIDIGGGMFDHHGKERTTVSALVSEYLGIAEDPALGKLLPFAERDDFYGKGIVSEDPLDRAFGLPALITNLNRSHPDNPGKVINPILPIIKAHYEEEVRRTKELPEEIEKRKANFQFEELVVRQRDKKLKVVIVTSDNVSMASYLRSRNGGGYDVVVQWRDTSGHLNILTRQTKRIDLRALALLLRLEELRVAGKETSLSARELSAPGRLREIPEWYFDPATNSIQNGGAYPKDILETKIKPEDLRQILDYGLGETLWSPVQQKIRS